MKRLLVLFVLFTLLIGCTVPQPDPINIEATISTGIEQTQAAPPTIPTTLVQTNTLAPTNTLPPTNTPRPTSTPEPTATTVPTLTPTEIPSQGIAKNYLASDEDAGIVVEVVRIEIAPKASIHFDFSDEIFDDKPIVVGFTFRIINNNDMVISSRLHHGIASVNGEQIDLYDYWLESEFGDDISGVVLPGSYVIGGYWTGIKRSSWEEVNKIVISFDYFIDSDYNRVTKDFLFTIDVIDWAYEPLPDELK